MLNYTATCRGRDKKPGDNILNCDFFDGTAKLESLICNISDTEDFDRYNMTRNLKNTTFDTINLNNLIESSVGEITRIGNLVAALRSNAD